MNMTMIILTILFSVVQLTFGISLCSFMSLMEINEMSIATESSATHRTDNKALISETISNTS